jgi:ComF family protein
MRPVLTKAASDLADVIFPPVCVSCGGLVEESGYKHICRRCAAKISFVEDPACSICGHPFFGEMEGERICPHCEGLAPAFRTGRTCVLFKEPARALIHELKYRRGLFCLGDIEAVIRRCERVVTFIKGAILVPVPLHARKERERGYNQSLFLAECFARAAGEGTRVVQLLEREVDTNSQTAFDRKARRANLKNAFSLQPNIAIKRDQHFVLVDDVFTTGSTLNSCAAVLRRAGCLNLDVVTFGHG